MPGFEVELAHGPDADVKAQSRVMAALRYLGPWCSRCGKRGRDCKDRDACRLRHITRK